MAVGFMGHIRAPNKDHLLELSYRRNGRRLMAMGKAVVPPPVWDSRAMGWVGAVKNQASCGSCWDFSGTFVVEVAYNKAGVGGGPDKLILSEQYTLSCGQNGGCNGDDNTTVLEWAKKTGLPLTADYGEYGASAGQCAFKQSDTLYKIDDWGFADGSGGNGVAPTPAIKTAIMEYGCVGSGVAAGGDNFWDSGTGTGIGTSSSIDHDVGIVGWDDNHDNGDGSKGAWIMRNSWANTWGDKCANSVNPNPVEGGYAWVKYGAYDLGNEAVWAVINQSAPPIDYYV